MLSVTMQAWVKFSGILPTSRNVPTTMSGWERVMRSAPFLPTHRILMSSLVDSWMSLRSQQCFVSGRKLETKNAIGTVETQRKAEKEGAFVLHSYRLVALPTLVLTDPHRPRSPVMTMMR